MYSFCIVKLQDIGVLSENHLRIVKLSYLEDMKDDKQLDPEEFKTAVFVQDTLRRGCYGRSNSEQSKNTRTLWGENMAELDWGNLQQKGVRLDRKRSMDRALLNQNGVPAPFAKGGQRCAWLWHTGGRSNEKQLHAFKKFNIQDSRQCKDT